MALPTNYYVDPATGTDAVGKGAVGDPYLTMQYALDDVGTTHGRDATNGDQMNLVSGTANTLAASLTVTTYGTPSIAAPLVIRGCSSAANDGGVGEVNCGGSYSLFADTGLDSVWLVDLHIHNAGAANIVLLDNYCKVIHCEINYTTGHGIYLDYQAEIRGCHVYDCGNAGIHSNGDGGTISYNFCQNTTANRFNYAISCNGGKSYISRNIISIDGSSVGIGIHSSGDRSNVEHNSIFCSSGSGAGVFANVSGVGGVFVNNVVEGFTTGEGFDFQAPTSLYLAMSNAAYNNGTNYANEGDQIPLMVDDDNETLTASPFVKSGADTFANRFIYFEPADTGNVRTGAYPDGSRCDKGAVQHPGGVIGGPNKRGGKQ